MYPSQDARELTVLLRISRDIDVVGDVTATLDSPSELLAWAAVLSEADIVAWRSRDSGHRYLQVTAARRTAPVRGRVAAVLPCEHHEQFWDALGLADLAAGGIEQLDTDALSKAWSQMPITPADAASPPALSHGDAEPA
jgi:hypothetical protein